MTRQLLPCAPQPFVSTSASIPEQSNVYACNQSVKGQFLTNLSLPGTLDETSANLAALPAASSAYIEAGYSRKACAHASTTELQGMRYGAGTRTASNSAISLSLQSVPENMVIIVSCMQPKWSRFTAVGTYSVDQLLTLLLLLLLLIEAPPCPCLWLCWCF